MNRLDRVFWTTLRRCWSRWADVLVIVQPATIIGWHRAGFRLYWHWRSRLHGGRPKIAEEIRGLIRRLGEENPDWGAPKIHGEVQKLGFVISERTVARYLRRIRRRGDPRKGWLTFLHNHREVVVALDFFTVPTVTFKPLYCFFVIEHGRRKILHFNVTRYPTADWVIQQLREAFAEASPFRYVVFDRDTKFDESVIAFLQTTGLTARRTSVQSPWQNGTAERWIAANHFNNSGPTILPERFIPLGFLTDGIKDFFASFINKEFGGQDYGRSLTKCFPDSSEVALDQIRANHESPREGRFGWEAFEDLDV